MSYHKKINQFIKDKKRFDSEKHFSRGTLPSWAKNLMISAGIATSLIACPKDNSQTTPSEDTDNPPSRKEQGGGVQPGEPDTPVVPDKKTPKKDPQEPREPEVRPMYGVPTP
ncbi:MAG: hypothetical protein ACQES9_12805 [Myxococcota bacterium]